MTIPNIFNTLFKTELFSPSISQNYLTKYIKKELTLDEKEKELILFRLNDTKMRLYIVENAFNHELKFEMIDAYIHEMNGLRLQYSYLTKQAKKLNITNDYLLKEEF